MIIDDHTIDVQIENLWNNTSKYLQSRVNRKLLGNWFLPNKRSRCSCQFQLHQILVPTALLKFQHLSIFFADFKWISIDLDQFREALMETNTVLGEIFKIVVIVLDICLFKILLKGLSHIIDLAILSFVFLYFWSVYPCKGLYLCDCPLTRVGGSEFLANWIGFDSKFLEIVEEG